jgi:hypothetical protein
VAGDRITDGKNGDVDCSVTKSGSGYRIHGELEEGATSFALDGTVVDAGDGSYRTEGDTGSSGFYHPNSGNIYSVTCSVEILPSQEVGTGKAWGNYSCTQSTKEGVPGFSCNFEGSFIFENCN